MEAPFDRRAVRRHRDRAAAALAEHDFLLREAAVRLLERLPDDAHYGRALAIGGGRLLADALAGVADTLVTTDLAAAMVVGPLAVAADEELLPFAAQSFDLVASTMALHWVNDLPGALVQIRRALKPGGLFIGTMLGGETLRELRAAFLAGEADVRGGVSPRVSPFADVRDAGNLLQRVGLADAMADIDTITVTYAGALPLMAELRGMGEANALRERKKTFTGRATLRATAAAYAARFAAADGRVPATFQLLTLTGWQPRQHTPPAAQAAARPPAAGSRRRLRQA